MKGHMQPAIKVVKIAHGCLLMRVFKRPIAILARITGDRA